MGQGRKTSILFLAALAAGVLALPSNAAAAPTVHRTGADAQAVREYWTPERIDDAIPLDTLPSSASPLTRGATVGTKKQRRRKSHKQVRHVRKLPFRASGKVFFSEGINDYVCSGTAVRSGGQSLVWTAGHCVYERAGVFGGYVSNWMFVPAFSAGNRPYGTWVASSLATTPQYRSGSSLPGDDQSSYDFGAATVAPNGGKTLQQAVGARKIAFKRNPRQGRLHAFGYPAQPPPKEFDGRHLFRCDSKLVTRDHSGGGPSPLGIDCDMTGGASGGGWVNDRGKVVSVTSYGYASRPGVLYGPYQGGVARSLYNSVSGG